ncbi:hypothetical protein ALC57_17641 [Trachymyrmex cornetzi]|uniref:Uncharacterized protein n=1 Tax=Trachymyrmex cornetzi TaxID=471704 RepID=A0A151ITA3_9HYME|nr:hypothetical protein ALC57_17641 [Trachymyrmex cornetzi]
MPAYKLKPVWDLRTERLRCFDNCWKVARALRELIKSEKHRVEIRFCTIKITDDKIIESTWPISNQKIREEQKERVLVRENIVADVR